MGEMRLQHFLLEADLLIGMDMLHAAAAAHTEMRAGRLHAHGRGAAQQFGAVSFFQALGRMGNAGAHRFARQRIADEYFLAALLFRMAGMGSVMRDAAPLM